MAAAAPPRVVIAILPPGIGPEALGAVAGISPGVMSAGMAEVPAAQTYLDIGAGNRVFTSLYGSELSLPAPFAGRVPGWEKIVRRADSAPAEIVPGLLAASLQDRGVPAIADRGTGSAALIAADREGRLERASPPGCLVRRCAGMAVVAATPAALSELVASLRGDDLLIAFERPPPARRESLAIGIAGEGFDGNLTSDSTRTPGYVLATDLAPTVLERYGLDVPSQMSGAAIRSEGTVDPGAVARRADRLAVIAPRRDPVIYQSLLAWALVAALAVALTRGRSRDAVPAILGLSVAYLPALLLVGAALEPGQLLGERLLVLLGAPALAVGSYALLRGWAALALACGVTVTAYSLDMLAGSPLTGLSLLGPNPALGVRFFGIGNELEVTLAVLVPVGVGAGLAALAGAGRPPGRRAATAAFVTAGMLSALVFAAGRFGADVGAAIVFPAGAAAAAVALPGVTRNRRLLVALAAAPLIGLAALFAIDLTLGGDAHLSRSVFDAGGLGEVADVAERRLRLSSSSFERGRGTKLFWICAAGVALAVFQRNRIRAWLAAAPLARAGLIGAAAAVLLGVLANDSAATFLTLGTITLGAGLSFAYSQRAASDRVLRGGADP